MNPRTTGILLLVAAALGAFVYFYEIRGSARRQKAEELAKRIFPGVEAEAVQEIWLETSDGQSAHLELAAGGWRLLEPLAFPADEVALSGMASSLAQLGSEGVVEDPQPLETYGLGEGSTAVRFRAGDRQHVLRIGDKTPVGYNTYVAADEGDRVYTVASYRTNSFRRALSELRERRVLRFDRTTVERIAASWPGGGVTLEKQADEWRLLEPLEARADGETLEALLSDLAFLRADEFADDPPSDAAAGLDAPAFAVELVSRAPQEGEPARQRMAIGGKVVDGKHRLARGAEPSLYKIPKERLDDLPRSVTAYRYKTLARFPAGDAARLDLVFQEEGAVAPIEISAERGEGGWTSVPESIAPTRAARLAAELARLRASDIAADSPSPARLAEVGLSPPRVVLRAWGEPPETGEPALLAEVRLGEADHAKGIYAQAAGEQTLYLLDYGLAEHIPVSLDAFRNRFLSRAEGEVGPGEAGEEPPPDEDLEDVGGAD